VLAPGTPFVAAVPNAACLSVLGHDFWRDPTHVRFYDPLALQFFARQAGFDIVASGGNPLNQPGPPPDVQPPPVTTLPSLRDTIVTAVQRAAARPESDGGDQDAVTDAEVWAEVGNVLSTFDDRVQAMQHDLHRLHGSYANLLRQLYPANEVYVAAVVPDEPTTPKDPHDGIVASDRSHRQLQRCSPAADVPARTGRAARRPAVRHDRRRQRLRRRLA